MKNYISSKWFPCDGATAAAHIAYALNEIIAIYPITPSSSISEVADERASKKHTNIWNNIPKIIEMQSEAGAAGTIHGALISGSLATTFTSSQGLLLMIPNMFKIAGELTPTVFHVAARAIATQGLSIFGEHSDVMAVRTTGFAILSSNNPQEVMDFSLIAHIATLKSRIPFIHFFDGFRTSHEIQKIKMLTYQEISSLIDEKLIIAHRMRSLSPDHPIMKGTSQNPDIFFQSRESVNLFYNKTANIVKHIFINIKELTGRSYKIFDYIGKSNAKNIIVMMGSGCDAAHEVVECLNKKGYSLGLVKVRLYRPFSMKDFIDVIPESTEKIAVLDRTKEPGSSGEPLYLDIIHAIHKSSCSLFIKQKHPDVFGGRYGLGSKEFNPAMVKSVFDNLNSSSPKNNFTVGIFDDLTNNNLNIDKSFHLDNNIYQAKFYGLGGDGTVGANKNSIKIISNATNFFTQGYFVYDSKKAGALTISHLRFNDSTIRSSYLIEQADFIACHNFNFLSKISFIHTLKKNGIFLLNSPHKKNKIWSKIPYNIKNYIKDNNIKFYIINADSLAEKLGLGSRINIIMQAAFFHITNIIKKDLAIKYMHNAIISTYIKKGKKVIKKNLSALYLAIEYIEFIDNILSNDNLNINVNKKYPKFIDNVTIKMLEQDGDNIPTSKVPSDGAYPLNTIKIEKRALAKEIPSWIPSACIQCNKCSFVCPHAAIRAKVYNIDNVPKKTPHGWEAIYAKGIPQEKNLLYTLQVAPEDCTGCYNCVCICPVIIKDKTNENIIKKAINMTTLDPIMNEVKEKWNYFINIPQIESFKDNLNVKLSQLIEPLFEFSGACAGCGETPYIKLLTQLFGNRMFIANATGCSSIYGGNLPTTPYSTDISGRGPAWANSLFEDNAEFGLGIKLTTDKFNSIIKEKLSLLTLKQDKEDFILNKDFTSTDIDHQHQQITKLKYTLSNLNNVKIRHFVNTLDFISPKTLWIVGGDGWAYDIGFGGLDHVLLSGYNLNVLVLDTGVYSNTGGQASKATPLGAIAKFASNGKMTQKKDLGAIAISYGNVYVAQIAYASNMNQTIKVFNEAEKFNGPSLIIAYSQCIEHGIDMKLGTSSQDMAVKSGFWPLYRYNPNNIKKNKDILSLDSKQIKNSIHLKNFVESQNRFRLMPKNILAKLNDDIQRKWTNLNKLN